MNSDHDKVRGTAGAGELLPPNQPRILDPAGATAVAGDGGGGGARENHPQRSALPGHQPVLRPLAVRTHPVMWRGAI